MQKLLISVCFLIALFQTQAQDYKLEGNEVKLEKQILFETGTDKLKAESSAALEIIKKYLDDKSYISLLRVECHNQQAGSVYSDSLLQVLTEKRALAVCKALVKMGVDCKRLIPVGFGSTKPIADNNTPEGKAANKRVSFFNVALRGRLIGGMPADGGGKISGDPCN
jgi:OmpA-OmpF porin, OOP family